MSNTIVLNEPTVDTLISSWTGLQLERGPNATNLGAFSVVAQIPYVLGQTQYVYIDPTGATSDWYRVVRYGPSILGTYSPAWPVTVPAISSGDGARRSYKNCRRMLARRLGSLQVVTATADGSVDGTSFTATGLANQVDPNRYRSWWAMPTDGVSAGEIRTIGERALNASDGTITLAPPFISQIVRGTQLELHRLLPPDEEVGPTIGLRQCLNLALAELWTLDRLPFVGTGSTTLDLASFGDWLDPAAVYEIYAPALSGSTAQPFGPYVSRSDAAVAALDIIGLAASGSINVEVTRPGDTYIKVGGVWTDNQQGFQNDDDECLFQPSFLIEIALAYAYDALANSTTGGPQVRYEKRADEQRKKANVMKVTPGALPRPSERSHTLARGDEWNAGQVDMKSYWSM